MKNLQVRVDEDEIEDLDELAQETRLSRSEIARSALREGVRRLRMEKALGRYLNLEFTLSRAAQYAGVPIRNMADLAAEDRKSTRLNSSHVKISYAVFCLKKKKKRKLKEKDSRY